MPSLSIQLPVAIILLGGGLVASFAGYRLLRAMLAVYGFVGGVIITTLFVDQLQTWLAIVATIVGGFAGAVLTIAIYLAGVALFGAGLAAFTLSLMIDGEPHVWVLLATSLLGALVALMVRRYVLIVGTAFVGGWTAVVGGMALSQQEAALAATTGDVSQLFPMAPLAGQTTFALGWVVLGLVGSLVQLRMLSGARARRARRIEKQARGEQK